MRRASIAACSLWVLAACAADPVELTPVEEMLYPLSREDPRARTAQELRSARAKPTPRFDVDAPRPVEERGVRWTVSDGSGELLEERGSRPEETERALPHDHGPLPLEGARGEPLDETGVVFQALATTIDTTAWPYRTVAKLYMNFPSGAWYVCSGAMIGRRSVLTAGHCIYDRGEGGWARQVVAVPGQDGSYQPFGSASAVYINSVTGWTNDGSRESDYAMVTLDRNLGDVTGWLGLRSLALTSLLGFGARMDGYPAEGPYPHGDLQINDDGGIQLVWTTMLFYDLESFGGFSGSPVRRTSAYQDYVLGINTASNCALYRSCGTRLTGSRVEQIAGWMAANQGFATREPDPGPWAGLGGSTHHDVAAVSSDGSRLEAFVRGHDGAVWHRLYDGASWAGWQSLGGYLTSPPAVVSRAWRQLDLFAVGGDGNVWTKARNSASSWWPGLVDWARLPGTMDAALDSPAATASGVYRLDVYVTSTSGKLYWQYWAGAGWTGWQQLAASTVFDSPPAAVVGSDGTLNVVARDRNGALVALRCSTSCSSAWQWSTTVVGGGTVLRGRPSLVSFGSGQLALFARGNGADVRIATRGATGWGALGGLGGCITDDVGAVSRAPGLIDIFVRGCDGAVYTKAFNGASWVPSQQGYWWLGGAVNGTPTAISRQAAGLDVFVRDAWTQPRLRQWTGATGWRP
jgi:V8-like Glu-specific endopeptidase